MTRADRRRQERRARKNSAHPCNWPNCFSAFNDKLCLNQDDDWSRCPRRDKSPIQTALRSAAVAERLGLTMPADTVRRILTS